MPVMVVAIISFHLATIANDTDGSVSYRERSLQNNTKQHSSRQRIGLNEQVSK